jgi:hypothetical protein
MTLCDDDNNDEATLEIWNHWVCGLCPSSGTLNNYKTRELYLFPFSGKGNEISTPLGPSEEAESSD